MIWFKWGIGIFFLHDSDGRALQANRAGPNWPNPSSPFLLMSTGNTKAPYHLDRLRKNADPLFDKYLSIRVPRRDLIVTKCNGAKIATARSRLIDLENPQLRGFWCTCNPLCGIWLGSLLYEFMLWNQPFVFTSLQKGEVVIPGTNSVQGLCQWPSRPARVKKSNPRLYLWPGWMQAWRPIKARN